MLIILCCLLTTVLLFLFYLRLKWINSYWKRSGVLQSDPIILFGNVKDFIFMSRSEQEVVHELYHSVASDEPALGYYEMTHSTILIKHFSLAKKILIDEFSCFHGNDWHHEPSDLILNNHPSYTKEEGWWKYLRSIGTQLHRPDKLNKIIQHLVTCCNHMVEHISDNSGRVFHAHEISAVFSTDSSIRSIYGLHSNSFQNINCIYKKINEKLFDLKSQVALTKLLIYFFPMIGRLFKATLTPKLFSDFYLNLVRDSIKYRAKYEGEIEMFDFLQVLMELNEKDEHLNFDLEEMTGHTLTLLCESYATTSVALTHILDLLSTYNEVQNELRCQIQDKIYSKDDISYQVLQDIPYLNAFIMEVLRLRPPIPVIHKVCTKECVLQQAGKKYPFRIGDRVTIPVLSIQTDPKYFQDPLVFDPDRFIDVPADQTPGHLAFGLGPRTCLGKNFALIQIKVFIVALLKNFRIIRYKMEDKIEFDERQLYYLKIKGNIPIQFILIQDETENEILI